MNYSIKLSISGLLLASICATGCSGNEDGEKVRKIDRVDFSHVKIDDAFWSPRLDKHKTATLPVCIDQIENQTERMRNFEKAAEGSGEHSGIFFDDSDVYKALEGIAYSLINNPDHKLEKKADEWIDKFADAQQPDGYLNTYYILTGLDKRWTDMQMHEMYCAGHMFEAAVTYYQATGKRKLLDVSCRMADHMMSLFGPGKRHWVPGHEEVELALVKLSETAARPEYLDFAHWLIEERGHGYGDRGGNGEWDKAYYQDTDPVSELTDIWGHAVRCMYLYSGMADVAAHKNDTTYLAALDRLWDDVVLRNMYVTGGIGSSRHNEGFTEDYDLPNKEAYCETCASVGMVMWNHRMNLLTGDSKYIDVLERSMYNSALAGVSLDGDKFFYVNPLESDGDHHRQPWYDCACCPGQVSRFLPSIGNYIYSTSDNALWINLFIGNTTHTDIDGHDVTITQTTGYPWDGEVRLTIAADRPVNREIRIRIPDWCEKYSLTVNSNSISVPVEKGYAVIKDWNPGEEIGLHMDMPAKLVAADPRVKQNVGKRAVQRGPLIYCVEEVDNKTVFDKLTINKDTELHVVDEPTLPGHIKALEAQNVDRTIRLIPYYAWDNREPGRMKVWLDYDENSVLEPVRQ